MGGRALKDRAQRLLGKHNGQPSGRVFLSCYDAREFELSTPLLQLEAWPG
jgi:hypothetical protein